MAGLIHGCLPKGLLLGGTAADVALLESSSLHGSSEPLLVELSSSNLPGALFIGAPPTAWLLGAFTAGSAPSSVSPGSSSSEELTRDSLTERYPMGLLLGGNAAGHAHEGLLKWSLFG
jgi:hypothetical protein